MKSCPTKRALDGWYAPRFFGVFLNASSFPFLSLVLNQPPVTRAVGQQHRDKGVQ